MMQGPRNHHCRRRHLENGQDGGKHPYRRSSFGGCYCAFLLHPPALSLVQSGWDILLPGRHWLMRMWEAPSACLALSAPDCGVSDGYSRGSPPTLHEPSPMSFRDFWGPATFLASLSQLLVATLLPIPPPPPVAPETLKYSASRGMS